MEGLAKLASNDLSYKVRGCIFEVSKHLGPGLLESAYERALVRELRLQGLRCETQVPVVIDYKGEQIHPAFFADIVVEGELILELKAVESVPNVFRRQLATYLHITNRDAGLLVNFGDHDMRHGIERIINRRFDPTKPKIKITKS